MSTQIFPSTAQCPGIDITISRKVEWDTLVQVAVSGKETRVTTRIYPRREFGLKFNFLRSSTLAGFQPAVNELATFEGFFNSRQGMFDSFLWTDPDDNGSSLQGIGSGDSTATQFQLARSFGGYVEPVYAPNAVTNVYVGSSIVSTANYSVSQWGTTSPGVVTFSTTAIPPNGQSVQVDMTYYVPVRFTDDNMTFERFVNLIYENKSVSFISII